MFGSGLARFAVVTLALCLMSGSSAAQQISGFYVEGNLGYASGPEVDTEAFSGRVANLTFSRAGLSAAYGDDVTVGMELGVVTRSNFRVGIGVTSLEFDIDNLSGSGTVDTGANVFDLSRVTLSREELGRNAAAELRTAATLYSVNSYYDFRSIGRASPFVGGGLGLTDIEDARDKAFTASFYAGIRIPLRNGFYIGGRFSHHRVDGPTDAAGISYDDFGVTGVSLLFGLRF
jgi:opacity protein-like surface antigen